MAIEITTDNKWKKFKYGYEVPRSVLDAEYSHLSEDEAFDQFFQYRGRWYHISDFMVIGPRYPSEFRKWWDGYLSDSAFSGIVIRVSKDGEDYKVGTFIS